MTSACCCGTTRIAREMTMMATTNSAIVNSDEPTHMANASIVESHGDARSRQADGRRSESTSREPRVATMYSVSARGTSGDASSASQVEPR